MSSDDPTAAGSGSAIPLPVSLDKSDQMAMISLGYSKVDYADMTVGQVREIIANKTKKPGSRSHAAQVNTAAQPAGMRLPDAYTDNSVKERTEGKPVASAFVITDEWENRGMLEQGNIFDNAARPYKEANPDKTIAFQSEEVRKRLGTDGYQAVRDQNGQPIRVWDQEMCFKPTWAVEEDARRRHETVNAPLANKKVRAATVGADQDVDAFRDLQGDRAVQADPNSSITVERGGVVRELL